MQDYLGASLEQAHEQQANFHQPFTVPLVMCEHLCQFVQIKRNPQFILFVNSPVTL